MKAPGLAGLEPEDPFGEPTTHHVGTRPGGGLAASYLVTVVVLVTINFFLPRALPGDPISAMFELGTPTYLADDAIRAELEGYYGLDRPILQQYGRYLSGLARGDLGTSIRYRAPVAELLRERLPWTLLLVLTAMALAVAAGWLGGVHSGWHRGRRVDQRLLAVVAAFDSFPVFFLGSMALFVFAVKLRWFPLAGAATAFSASTGLWTRVADVAHHPFTNWASATEPPAGSAAPAPRRPPPSSGDRWRARWGPAVSRSTRPRACR